MPNKLLHTCKIGSNDSNILILFKKLDLEFKMCLPTSASGTLEGPEEVLETQIVIKMLPECSPMSQQQIETLISKI